jgi:hypothetical protein
MWHRLKQMAWSLAGLCFGRLLEPGAKDPDSLTDSQTDGLQRLTADVTDDFSLHTGLYGT